MNPTTGQDLEQEYVIKISELLAGNYTAQSETEEAQLRELAFWRWVAYEGYMGRPPLEFIEIQREYMTRWLDKTGWGNGRFVDKKVFELGCGPVGMIEFVNSRSRWGYDPLNPHYGRLFENLRSGDVQYIHDADKIKNLPRVDLGICFNVLDHTDDAAAWFARFFDRIKSGGHFLLQVNVVRDDLERTDEHKKMHPSPLTAEQVRSMLATVSAGHEEFLDPTPSADNEFFYMAWGKRSKRLPGADWLDSLRGKRAKSI